MRAHGEGCLFFWVFVSNLELTRTVSRFLEMVESVMVFVGKLREMVWELVDSVKKVELVVRLSVAKGSSF